MYCNLIGTGFIGKHILKNLLDVGIYANVLKSHMIKHTNLIEGPVIYCSGSSNVKTYHSDLQQVQYDIHNLISCLKLSTPICSHFIYISSSNVYNGGGDKECCEDDVLFPSSMYGKYKLFCEHLVKQYMKTWSIIRPCANTGVLSTHGVVHDLYKKIKYDDSNNIALLGNSFKPLVHADDTARACIFALLNKKYGEVYNVARESIYVSDIMKTMDSILKKYKEFYFSETDPYQSSILINSDKIIKDGFKYRYNSSIDAILKTVTDYEVCTKY